MRRKLVSLYIDDTSIRLLVTEGKRVKKWADLPLEAGLIEAAVVQNEAGVAGKIRTLLRDQKVHTKKVALGLSGLHCFTRPVSLPPLPKAVLPDAVMRVAETTLPLPLDQLYVSWQTIPAPAGQTQVFVTAVRRKAADAMLKTLARAGLKASIMDIKPLALARLVREPTAVMVDVQAAEFDIVIMVEGVSQPIRTVAFPREALSWEERFPLIRNELDRTIKFYNANNPGKLLPADVSTFVSGELVYRPELCRSLSRELGHPISVLASPLGAEQVDLSRHMVNIGVLLKHNSLAKYAGGSLVSLNLLPAPYCPKPVSAIRMAAIPAVAVVGALIVPTLLFIQGASASMDAMRGELDATNKLILQRQSERQELSKTSAELDKKVGEALAVRDKLSAALGSFKSRHAALEGDLGTAAEVLGAVRLVSLSHSGDAITLNAVSVDEAGVLNCARYLDESECFAGVTISRMSSGQDGSVNFTLILKAKGV